MTWEIIVAIVFGLIAAGAYGASFATPEKTSYDTPARAWTRVGAAAAASITVLFLVIGSFTVVSTRNIGVTTTFGRPSGTLSNGLHLKWPWQAVTEMDGAIQIDWHKDDDGGDGHGAAIQVRLGNSSTAYADTSVRWELQQGAADDLFLQYKTFDNVRTNLVTRNLQVALNEVFATFDPLAPQNLNRSPLPDLSGKATRIMQEKVGDQIKVLEVQIPTIDYDGGTEDKINQLNQQRAQTATALEAQKTAAAQAEANRILAASVSNDPNVVVSNCIGKALDKGISPLGCWPGTTAVPTIPVR